MKTKTLLLGILMIPVCFYANAQTNLAGSYAVTGYIFHPSVPRVLNAVKTVTQISANTYQVQLADLGGCHLSFSELDTYWFALPQPAKRVYDIG